MDEKIKTILESQNPWWFNTKLDTGINRLENYDLKKYFQIKEILLLIGVRRTGKSTLMIQLIENLIKSGTNPKEILFINLDEPYFINNKNEPNLLTNLIEEYLIENKTIKKLYLFIDEIQVFNFWSESLKYLYDVKQNIKIVASGSSSNLIESKLAVKLSGRYFHKFVYPLTFKEYLEFNNLKKLKSIEYKNKFNEYLLEGGFPRVVLEKDKTLKNEILKNYFQTIYLKDIVLPNNLRNNEDIYNLLYYLTSNVSKFYSYNSLSKTLGISVDTVKEYLEFANKTYFLFNLNMYDKSVKKQIANQKKIYLIDTGIANTISFRSSEDYGRMLENLVFIELKRRAKNIYYHKGKKECDFVLKEGLNITSAIQVTKSLLDNETKKREFEGLLDAIKTYNLKEGLILTENEEFEEICDGGVVIRVKPIWKWLLENQNGD